MKYTEVIINTKPEKIAECCSELEVLGIYGYITENEADFESFFENNTQYWDYVDESLSEKYKGISRLKLYINDDEEGSALLKSVLAMWPDAETSSVQDSDWENNWKEFYKPIEIGKRLVVVPQWEDIPSDGRVPLILDPGLIFGTGSHATTRMCLEAIEQADMAGKKVLDLGCGSGILGIGALVLGAESNRGVDIDPKAPDVAMANAALNSIGEDKMKVYAGDITADRALINNLGTGYDIVLANIVADVILSITPHVRKFMAEDARYICSGIIDGREKEVEACLIRNGFNIISHIHEEEWNCYICS